MTIPCPTCQAENSADNRFCFRCGTALAAASAPTTDPARVMPAPPAAPPPISGAPVAPPPRSVLPASGPGGPPPATYPGAVPGPPAPARSRPVLPLALGCLGAGTLLLLLALGLMIVAAVVRPGIQSGPTQPTGIGSSAPTPVAGGLDAAIRAAVDASNRAQIEALRTLDDQPLRGVVIGRALDDNLQILANLQRARTYAVSTLDHIDYQPARQLDADHASIRTVESWTTLYYRQGTDALVRRQQSTGLQEIYYLVRQDGRWVVEQIDIRDPNSTPAPGDTQ